MVWVRLPSGASRRLANREAGTRAIPTTRPEPEEESAMHDFAPLGEIHHAVAGKSVTTP